MSREFDARTNAGRGRPVNDARVSELRAAETAVSDRLAGNHTVAIGAMDDATGNPSLVMSHTAEPTPRAAYVARASAHLADISPVLGLTPGFQYRVDPLVATTSSGGAAVHAEQQHRGIPVFQAAEVVRFTPAGVLESTAGTSVTVAGLPSISPTLSSVAAVIAAARHVAVPEQDEVNATDQFGEPMYHATVDLSGFAPAIVSEEPGAERRTYLGGAPLPGTIGASLAWFPLAGDLHLAWQVVLKLPTSEQWRVLVDAHVGAILYAHCLTLQVLARGNVYTRDGVGPRQLLDFPRPLASYNIPLPAGLPAGLPRDWVAFDRTEGNAVNAHAGAAGASVGGSVVNGTMTFDPANATGEEQMVLNIFFLCNYMCDYLYLLGFREAEGNFQQNNFGLGGSGFDRVDARAHAGAVPGTANWSPDSLDGNAPVMNMGLVSATGRHTAFDSGVVYHEYTHGLTQRLVGGATNSSSLEALQSGSMGEGWSDYIACSINNVVVLGSWVIDRPGGFRQFAYDANFPDHYGKLGTGRYDEVHNNGEIWCAALMEMNRRIGTNLGVQCVVDGLKLTPGNPTYLQARDAILVALDHKATAERWTPVERRNRRRGMWGAFAKFGMGRDARSGAASTTVGIVADFTIPPELDTVGPWAADFVGGAKAEILFNRVTTGEWSLANFTANEVNLTPVANTVGFGDLGDGSHPAWVGDFTGSGKKQILFNYVGDGNWWLGTLTGFQFSFARVANTIGFGNLADGKHPAWVGDFTGSGRTQILFNYTGDGNWWLGTMNAGQLTFAKVGNTLGFGDIADGAHPAFLGDFAGSGRAQVLFNYVGDGNWWLGSMVGGQLLFAKVANTAGFGNLADGKHPAWVGQFTGSKTQVLFNYIGDGNWWLGSLNAGELSFALVANTAGFGDLADGKHPSWVGDFAGSATSEVLFNYVGDGNWWLGSFTGAQLTFANIGNTLGFGDLADGMHPSWAEDFAGNGKTEILFHYYGDGHWWRGSVANGRITFAFAGSGLGVTTGVGPSAGLAATQGNAGPVRGNGVASGAVAIRPPAAGKPASRVPPRPAPRESKRH